MICDWYVNIIIYLCLSFFMLIVCHKLLINRKTDKILIVYISLHCVTSDGTEVRTGNVTANVQ